MYNNVRRVNFLVYNLYSPYAEYIKNLTNYLGGYSHGVNGLKTVLFVCTGNTCRSSMAEAIFKDMLKNTKKGKDSINVLSAGISAVEGESASRYAIQVMSEQGIDLTCHRAKLLTLEMVNKADFILTMTSGHKMAVMVMYPNAHGKTFTLKEYARRMNKNSINDGYSNLDIPDPYGQSIEVYRQCAKQIKQEIIKIIDRLDL